MWSLKWYYLGIRSSGKALTSGVMLFTFNKRCSSDSKLWECVMEEVSSLPLAGRIVSTGISTRLQQLTEVANECEYVSLLFDGPCLSLWFWRHLVIPPHPQMDPVRPSRLPLIFIYFFLELLITAAHILPSASTRQLLAHSLLVPLGL